MLSERNQSIVVERDRGDTIVEIGERHGISHQRVSAIVSEASRVVVEAYLDLMVSQKTGEQCAYVIPYGPDYQVAVAFADWLVAQLRDMGVELEIETRRASNGLALLLTDVTPIGGRHDRHRQRASAVAGDP